MRALPIILIAALVAPAALSGCIQNMDDLKDRLQRAASDDATDLDANLTDATGNVTNATGPQWKPPVARVSVYAEDGALAYKADFEAANQTEPVIVAGGNVSLVAGESEVLEANSTLEKFTWDVDGTPYEGRQVTVELREPGVHMVTLTVTDSKGSTDAQMVHLGILPEPFTLTETLTGGAAVGVDAVDPAAGQGASVEFTVLSEQDGKPLKVQQITVTASAANPTADSILVVTSPSGTETVADSASAEAVDGAESLTFAEGESGVWTATLRMFAGVTHEWTATIEVTYVQDVPGLSGGDGHGGHAH